ncbi:MAG: hypothetical protein ABIU95_03305, partial [Burkholderiales bacterium]
KSEFGRGAGVMAMGAQSVDQVVATIGNPGADHVEHIHKLLRTLPDEVRTGLATPDGAKGIVLGLLVPEAAADTDLRGVLEGHVDIAVIEQARWLAGPLVTLDGHLKLPLAALAFPVLRALPNAERERFVQAVRAIVAIDNKVTPFEFALTAMLRQQLGERGASRGQARRIVPLKSVEADAATLLSLFVRAASQGSTLFDQMAAKLGLTGAELLPPSRVSLTTVEVALARLVHLAPADKSRVIRVCLEAVLSDSRVSVREGELMRAVCAVLDTPLPPIIDRSVVVPEMPGVSV